MPVSPGSKGHSLTAQVTVAHRGAGKAGGYVPQFCDRFSALVGRAPLRYQNDWRLTLVTTMLATQNSRIGDVGFAVGYESEPAFSRAYKAFFSRSPREDHSARRAVGEQHR